jgi:hypothetical protein
MEQNAHNQNTRKIEEKALETHPKNPPTPLWP